MYDRNIFTKGYEMKTEPVAWIKEGTLMYLGNYNYASITIQVQKSNSVGFDIPLYTHPHPDNLGLAESIIKQQELQIEALKEELKKSAEVNRLLAEDIGYEE